LGVGQYGDDILNPEMALFSTTQVQGRVQSVVDSWGFVKSNGSSVKWSEDFAKGLEEVHEHELAIGVEGRYG
jgi:hypothetical protein